jgi:hypothetical protein
MNIKKILLENILLEAQQLDKGLLFPTKMAVSKGVIKNFNNTQRKEYIESIEKEIDRLREFYKGKPNLFDPNAGASFFKVRFFYNGYVEVSHAGSVTSVNKKGFVRDESMGDITQSVTGSLYSYVKACVSKDSELRINDNVCVTEFKTPAQEAYIKAMIINGDYLVSNIKKYLIPNENLIKSDIKEILIKNNKNTLTDEEIKNICDLYYIDYLENFKKIEYWVNDVNKEIKKENRTPSEIRKDKLRDGILDILKKEPNKKELSYVETANLAKMTSLSFFEIEKMFNDIINATNIKNKPVPIDDEPKLRGIEYTRKRKEFMDKVRDYVSLSKRNNSSYKLPVIQDSNVDEIKKKAIKDSFMGELIYDSKRGMLFYNEFKK